MATPKRIQVQLRDSSLEQVEQLAEQMNISLSKACAFLVDEALALRQNHPPAPTFKTEVVAKKSTPELDLDDDDIKLLKKIKLLKALDL